MWGGASHQAQTPVSQKGTQDNDTGWLGGEKNSMVVHCTKFIHSNMRDMETRGQPATAVVDRHLGGVVLARDEDGPDPVVVSPPLLPACAPD